MQRIVTLCLWNCSAQSSDLNLLPKVKNEIPCDHLSVLWCKQLQHRPVHRKGSRASQSKREPGHWTFPLKYLTCSKNHIHQVIVSFLHPLLLSPIEPPHHQKSWYSLSVPYIPPSYQLWEEPGFPGPGVCTSGVHFPNIQFLILEVAYISEEA